MVPRAALFLNEQLCPLVFVENNHNTTSNLSPASFIHGSLAAWQSQHMFASWWGGEGRRHWRLDVKGQVRPLALALALSPADQAAASSELAFEALPPTLQAHTLPLTSLTPSSHISLLPSPLSRQSSLPPEDLLTHHPLFPQFSLDRGKARYFLSLGAQLKHRHLREVLPGHSPLLAHNAQPPTAQGRNSTNSGATGEEPAGHSSPRPDSGSDWPGLGQGSCGPRQGREESPGESREAFPPRRDSGWWAGKITGVHPGPSPSPEKQVGECGNHGSRAWGPGPSVQPVSSPR